MKVGIDFGTSFSLPAALINGTSTDSRPTDRATVSKVLRDGFIYKGQVLRRAQVEFVDGGGAS